MKKAILKIATLGCLLTSAQAMSFDIYGLDIELGDVSMTGGFNQNLVYTGDGSSFGFGDYELQGYGLIGKLNDVVGGGNNNQAPFSCTDVLGPGVTDCNLVFNFGGFTLDSVTPTSISNNGIDFYNALSLGFGTQNSFVNFYVVDASYNVDAIGNAGYNQSIFNDIEALIDGPQQYLDLTADTGIYTGVQLLPQPGVSNAFSGAAGGFEVQDQTQGAGWYYDLEDNTSKPDVQFSSVINGGNFSVDTIQFDAIPGAQISREAFGGVSFTTQVPEPSTLAMFSVALLGFGAAARRRRQA